MRVSRLERSRLSDMGSGCDSEPRSGEPRTAPTCPGTSMSPQTASTLMQEDHVFAVENRDQLGALVCATDDTRGRSESPNRSGVSEAVSSSETSAGYSASRLSVNADVHCFDEDISFSAKYRGIFTRKREQGDSEDELSSSGHRHGRSSLDSIATRLSS